MNDRITGIIPSQTLYRLGLGLVNRILIFVPIFVIGRSRISKVRGMRVLTVGSAKRLQSQSVPWYVIALAVLADSPSRRHIGLPAELETEAGSRWIRAARSSSHLSRISRNAFPHPNLAALAALSVSIKLPLL